MNEIVKKIKSYSASDYVHSIGSLSSIIGLSFFIADRALGTGQTYMFFSTFLLCLGAIFISVYYAIRHWHEYGLIEKNSINFARSSHKINHQYRNYTFKLDKQLSEWLSNIELANDRTALDLAEKLFKTELRTIYLKFFHQA